MTKDVLLLVPSADYFVLDGHDESLRFPKRSQVESLFIHVWLILNRGVLSEKRFFPSFHRKLLWGEMPDVWAIRITQM